MLSCRVWRRRCFCSVVGFGGGRWVGAVPGLGDEAATRVGRSAGSGPGVGFQRRVPASGSSSRRRPAGCVGRQRVSSVTVVPCCDGVTAAGGRGGAGSGTAGEVRGKVREGFSVESAPLLGAFRRT